jgi:hypothetical protein
MLIYFDKNDSIRALEFNCIPYIKQFLKLYCDEVEMLKK